MMKIKQIILKWLVDIMKKKGNKIYFVTKIWYH